MTVGEAWGHWSEPQEGRMEQLSPGGTGSRGRDVSLGGDGGVSGHRWRSVPPSGLRADGARALPHLH